MSWRIVMINSQCKLSYKNDYMYVRGETVNSVHISEISVLIVASTQVNITAMLLAELAKRKIKTVFCDEKHNPYGELALYYGCHNSSKKIESQICWDKELQLCVSDAIVMQKIRNQAALLKKYQMNFEADMLYSYADEFEKGDLTNREGHAAKVYFNALFGKKFTRDCADETNSKLDYGYTILLSVINREVVCNGCLTQLGIKHHNEFNQFNLSCDLIEPWRPIVDEDVYLHKNEPFDSDCKKALTNLLNKQVVFMHSNYYLTNAVKLYVKGVDALNQRDRKTPLLYSFE